MGIKFTRGRRRRGRLYVIAVMATAGLLVTSGVASGAVSGGDNGVASSSPSLIVTSARRAINAVTTVHVSGVLSGGKTTLDLHLVTGTASISSADRDSSPGP